MKKIMLVLSIMLGLSACLSPAADTEIASQSTLVVDTPPVVKESASPFPAQTATATRQPPSPPPTITQTETLSPTITPDLSDLQVDGFEVAADTAGLLLDGLLRLRAVANGLWLLGESSAARWDGEAWVEIFEELPGFVVDVDDSGGLWVLSQEMDVLRLWDGETWTNFDESSGWSTLDDPYAFYQAALVTDLQGDLWYATSQDVRRFDGKRWTVFAPEDMGFASFGTEDLIHQFALYISQSDGRLWVTNCQWVGPGPAGGQGVRWYVDGQWQTPGGMALEGCTRAVTEDSRGYIWLALDGELWQYNPDGGQWRAYKSPDNDLTQYPRYGAVMNMIADADDSLLVVYLLCGGACCDTESPYRFNSQSASWAPLSEEEYAHFTSSFLLDGNGHAWYFDRASGLSRVEGNVIGEALPLFVSGLARSPQGDLWLLASTGYGEEMFIWQQK